MKQLGWGLLLVLGCGVAREDASGAHRIARVETDGAIVDFIGVSVLDDPSGLPRPSVMVQTQRSLGSVDPVGEVYASAPAAITTAELFLGLTQDEGALPEELALAHFRETGWLNRTPEFIPTWRQPIEPVSISREDFDWPEVTDVEKAVVTSGTVSTQTHVFTDSLTINSLLVDVPGRRWTKVQAGETVMACQTANAQCPLQPNPTVLWGCSNRDSFDQIGFYGLPGTSACSAKRTTGWVRVGFVWNYPGSTPDQYTIQGYYGVNQWQSFPAEAQPQHQLFQWDWNDPSSHALAVAFSGHPDFNLRPLFLSANSVPR